MANKKNKVNILKKRKKQCSRNQYTKKKILDNGCLAAPAPAAPFLDDNNTCKDVESPCSSLSSQKLNDSIHNLKELETNQHNYFFIINFEILKNVFNETGCCGDCQGPINLNDAGKMGFSVKLTLDCTLCDWSKSFNSSPEFLPPNCSATKKKSFEVNARSVIAFREIGRGHEAMATFTTMMNMPKPLCKASFNKWNDVLHEVYEETAQESISNAGYELRSKIKQDATKTEILDCQVSIDGAWQKRGHSSMNGVVTLIARETRKVLDYQNYSKFCRGCTIWERKKGTAKYDEWKARHICQINHYRSSGAMESVGAVAMFASSVDKHNLRYSHYIGDGDTGSYKSVVDSKPYGEDLIPAKLECEGHLQKRAGSKTRKLRNDWKGKKLSDGKTMSGCGRLTDKAINKMQNYYGMAIRQNSAAAWGGDRKKALYNMKKSVLAVLWHCTDKAVMEERHKFCPRNEESWCKYWQKKSDYKSSVNLPEVIHEELLPIFMSLRADDLLSRCLDGTTQNPNEAFNHIVWKKCPKDTFVSKKVLDIGVASAVIHFNDGFGGFQKLFARLNLNIGVYGQHGAVEKDSQRVKNMDRKSTTEGKKLRRKLRAVRKGHIDKEKLTEGGDSYVAGNF